jgi:hypothetical protein
MEEQKKAPSGFHWQLMGSEAPEWIDGYEAVRNWVVEQARDESVWESVLIGMQETLDLFRGRSLQRVESDLKLNKAMAKMKILHHYRKNADPEFTGCQGFIELFDKSTKEKVASRPFFVIFEQGKAGIVVMRAQIV